jgi:dolichol-phosphate mannosyltransferase
MVTILLPAYNEERDIRTLILRIHAAMQAGGFNYKVFVVNDGSTDGTVSAVIACQQEMPIELIDHGVNKGLGQAMLTGLRSVAKQLEDEDVLVTMDADNTHDPNLIPAMVEKVRGGPGDG